MRTIRRKLNSNQRQAVIGNLRYGRAVVKVEDFFRLRGYVLRMLELGAEHVPVSCVQLSGYIGMSDNTCDKRMREAIKCGWVEKLRPAAYVLTPKGVDEAKTLRRRQLVVARFLAATLNKPVSSVRAEAELMEGRISPELIAAMAQKLDLPIKASSLGNPVYESLRRLPAVKAEQPRFAYGHHER